MRLKRPVGLSALAVMIAAGATITVISLTGQGAHHAGTASGAGAVTAAGRAVDRGAAAPLPYGADPSAESTLGSVACPAALTCVAAGWYLDTSGNAQGLLVTTDGALWDAQTAPLPPDAGPAPNAQFNYAGQLTCPSVSECVAVGSYETAASHNPHSMLVTGSASKWTVTATPLPGDADPAQGSSLSAVTCPAPSRCVAVGSYADVSTGHGLLVTGSGSSWTATRAPLPAGVAARREALVSSVACSSASSCVAVGIYIDKSGTDHGLLLTGSGTSWTAATLPLPRDAAPGEVPGAANISLGPVACPAPSSCIVLGSYTVHAGYLRGMLLTGTGARWAASSVPVPAGADASYGTSAGSLACPSVASCIITGSYTDAYQYSHAMIITGSAAGWRAATAPLPAGAGPAGPSDIGSLTCPSPAACVAAGTYTDQHGYEQPMLITGSAAAWTSTEVRTPAASAEVKKVNGDFTPTLQAAACFTAGECMAAGSYPSSSGHDHALLIEPPPGPHPWPDIYLTTAFTIGLYTYPGFPAFIGLDNHSSISGISWKSVSAGSAEATGVLTTDNCTPDCASGKSISYPIRLIASSPRQCVVGTQLTPPLAVREDVFTRIDIVGQVPGVPAYLAGPKPLSLNCVAS
jgi:hypothetical protein